MCIPVFLIERNVRADTTWSMLVVRSLSLSSTRGRWESDEHKKIRGKLQMKDARWDVSAWVKIIHFKSKPQIYYCKQSQLDPSSRANSYVGSYLFEARGQLQLSWGSLLSYVVPWAAAPAEPSRWGPLPAYCCAGSSYKAQPQDLTQHVYFYNQYRFCPGLRLNCK